MAEGTAVPNRFGASAVCIYDPTLGAFTMLSPEELAELRCKAGELGRLRAALEGALDSLGIARRVFPLGSVARGSLEGAFLGWEALARAALAASGGQAGGEGDDDEA